jgi:hypothetical protein
LVQEREELACKAAVQAQPPQIDLKTAMAYRGQPGKIFKLGSPADKKRLLRDWVEEIRLAPERLEVEIDPLPVIRSRFYERILAAYGRKGFSMKKRHSPEQIVAKLRQADVALG